MKTFAVEYKDFEFNLLPCPFCGGKPHISDIGFPHWIYCESCGATVQGGETGIIGVFASVRLWNTRVNSETLIRMPEET